MLISCLFEYGNLWKFEFKYQLSLVKCICDEKKFFCITLQVSNYERNLPRQFQQSVLLTHDDFSASLQ